MMDFIIYINLALLFLLETRFPIMNKYTAIHPILQTATTHHYIGRDYTIATP